MRQSLRFAWIPPGASRMGSLAREWGASDADALLALSPTFALAQVRELLEIVRRDG